MMKNLWVVDTQLKITRLTQNVNRFSVVFECTQNDITHVMQEDINFMKKECKLIYLHSEQQS